MEPPLWIERHAPSLEELPQAEVRDRLERAAAEPMNLVVQGAPGVGKTAAVRALAAEAHDDPDADLVEINVADFFDRTKKEIREDPRFERFLDGRSRMAKRDMINHVLKESAAHAPVSGSYRTILLDNAEAIREDFQQALRRVMERHHRTTQFVVATRRPSKLIAPVRSRCFPVPVRAPTAEETAGVLASICAAEGVDHDAEGLEFVANAATGDLREAVLSAQTVAVEAGEITTEAAYEALAEAGDDDAVLAVVEAALDGDVTEARSAIDDLLEAGYDGQGLLRRLLDVARSGSLVESRDLARLHRLAGETDADLATGTEARIHLTRLFASWAAGR